LATGLLLLLLLLLVVVAGVGGPTRVDVVNGVSYKWLKALGVLLICCYVCIYVIWQVREPASSSSSSSSSSSHGSSISSSSMMAAAL
jgi:uncharacterized membrane protein YeiH